MARYIDGEKLPNDKFFNSLTNKEKAHVLAWILQQPTADVVEVKHGEWLDTGTFDFYKTPIYQCSVCRKEIADNYVNAHKYCLHCGACMDGKDE